jgi:hypothetical protein
MSMSTPAPLPLPQPSITSTNTNITHLLGHNPNEHQNNRRKQLGDKTQHNTNSQTPCRRVQIRALCEFRDKHVYQRDLDEGKSDEGAG